ncbi:MAG: hypothetical protein RLY93_04205 [Sumerlaeia bacterium]
MYAKSHEIMLGGAWTNVISYPGTLIVEVMGKLSVTEECGALLFWHWPDVHHLDPAVLPPNVEVALISLSGQVVEVWEPGAEVIEPRHPYVAAAVMPAGWFDQNCTSSRCSLDLD